MTDPQVTVIVTTINSQRVFILGEVNRAGVYPLLPNMTARQALSSAGGFTIYANLKKIYVLRIEDWKQVNLPVQLQRRIRRKSGRSKYYCEGRR